MSIFEAVMIIAFGCAWPASIYKSYVSRSNEGKSLYFMLIVLIGYIGGVIHKIIYSYDIVLVLYFVNFIMVAADICLYYRNSRIERKTQKIN